MQLSLGDYRRLDQRRAPRDGALHEWLQSPSGCRQAWRRLRPRGRWPAKLARRLRRASGLHADWRKIAGGAARPLDWAWLYGTLARRLGWLPPEIDRLTCDELALALAIDVPPARRQWLCVEQARRWRQWAPAPGAPVAAGWCEGLVGWWHTVAASLEHATELARPTSAPCRDVMTTAPLNAISGDWPVGPVSDAAANLAEQLTRHATLLAQIERALRHRAFTRRATPPNP